MKNKKTKNYNTESTVKILVEPIQIVKYSSAIFNSVRTINFPSPSELHDDLQDAMEELKKGKFLTHEQVFGHPL